MATKKDTIWQLTTISDLNDKKHNATIGMYNWEGKTYLYTYKSKHNGDIYESIINDNNITILEPLPYPINTRFHESGASIGPDGRILYFISDRPGGMGGKDIWMSQREHNDTWSTPINLSAINTPYDEEGVFIHPDGKTLYFSSKGHNTMGGYDIFISINDNSEWSNPINLGYPINTAADDLCFVLASSGQRAYFSSSRQGTIGDQDIFIINYMIAKSVMPSSEANFLAWPSEPSMSVSSNLLSAENLPSMILWKGKITDENGNPLEAQIILTDNETNEQIAVFTSNSETGNFLVSLPSGKNYGIAIKKDGYLFHSENFNIPENAPYEELMKDIKLKKVAAGAEIVFNNIFFDFNKATLRPESKTELKNVIEFLQQNPSVTIEISGHTDNVGSYEYNQSLSERRAKAVVDYLVKQGIPLSRLVYKGYSFSKPIASNDTEEGRQQNRRVEFKILSADGSYVSQKYFYIIGASMTTNRAAEKIKNKFIKKDIKMLSFYQGQMAKDIE